MTTASFNTRVRQDTDATFREWGAEFNAKLAAIGLVQTSDTGQINWTTVVRASTNSDAGYEIWRFNDSLQATAPIFIRINYGSGNTQSVPRVMIAVGIASNGAGSVTTIGGGAATARLIVAAVAQTGDITRQSYFCHVAGFLGLMWKCHPTAQSNTAPDGAFFIARTVDSTGAPTATGAMVWWGPGYTGNSATTQAMRFAATAVAYTVQTVAANAALCLNPQSPTSSLVGANNQVFLAWTIDPQVRPLVGVCGVLDSELNFGSTVSATLVGTTARTYIGGNAAMIVSPVLISSYLKAAMLWE